MNDNFQSAMVFAMHIEGGFFDDPDDPGEAIVHGITLKEFRTFKGYNASVDDLKAITNTDLAAIYTTYWNAVYGDQLPSGIDLSVFDMGFNAGPGTAIRQLQQVLDVPIDGIFGKVTLGAVEKCYPVSVCIGLWSAHVAYYQSLRTFADFGHGWIHRAKMRLSAALRLIS